nr:hypothetical protein [Burkholderia ambifaria]
MVTEGARIASIGWLTSPTLEKSHVGTRRGPTYRNFKFPAKTPILNSEKNAEASVNPVWRPVITAGDAMLRMSCVVFAAALALPLTSTAAPIGDWITGATDDGKLFAGSVNDSGGTLMKGCSPSEGVCYWYLVTSTSCDKGTTAPALFSTSSGAVPLKLICDGPITQGGRTMYRAEIADPDTMDSLLGSNRPLGIAVALDDGRFAVYRFSMAGAKKAVSILMQGALKLFNKSNQHDTRDSAL